MARFKFRMQTLLAMREAVRDQKRALLAEAYAAQRTLEDQRAELQLELDEKNNWLRSGAAPGRVDVDRMLAANRYDVVLRSQMSVLANQAKELAIEIERRREVVVAAEREVRVLEKLRERQHEQFRAQQALAEMKQLDEIASRAMHEELI